MKASTELVINLTDLQDFDPKVKSPAKELNKYINDYFPFSEDNRGHYISINMLDKNFKKKYPLLTDYLADLFMEHAKIRVLVVDCDYNHE